MADNPSRNFTSLGKETSFNGTLEFSDDLTILGKFTGTIKSTGNLRIAKGAVCNADIITANSVIIFGQVSGDITAKNQIELCDGSKIKGNLTSGRVRIGENVEYTGAVSMLKEEPSVDIFSVASDDFKKSLVM